MRLCWLTGILLLAVGTPAPARQPTFAARELADYRLTEPVFKKFVHATRLMLMATRNEQRFADAPLFSRDITVSGDAPEMATALQRRVDSDPLLAGAVFAADVSGREYATFAITLFAARLAYGFVKSGVLRAVPAGVPTHNVEFVAQHETAISSLFKELGLAE